MRIRPEWIICVTVAACGAPMDGADESEPEQLFTSAEQGLVSCAARQDTGYRNGVPFSITVVTADGTGGRSGVRGGAGGPAAHRAAAAGAAHVGSCSSASPSWAGTTLISGCSRWSAWTRPIESETRARS